MLHQCTASSLMYLYSKNQQADEKECDRCRDLMESQKRGGKT